ncbi:MAG: adenylate/guanylate cyclase domain-containing protein [Deferrisomatales bacterium]
MSARRRKVLSGILLAGAAALAVTLAQLLGAFDRLEWASYDARVRWVRARREAPGEIAVVLVDEASLRAMSPVAGRWPWPRSLFADLLEFLSLGGARAVVFDILFTEPETPGQTSPGDAGLARATEASGRAHHAAQVVWDEPDEFNRGLLGRPLPADFASRFALDPAEGAGLFPEAPRGNNRYLPLPALYRAARGVGAVDLEPDPDGVFRRAPLLVRYGDALFPSLALSPFAASDAPAPLRCDAGGLHVGSRTIPLGPDGVYLVHWYGRYDTYSIGGIFASWEKILRGEVAALPVHPEEFRDRIVFVGASAVGVGDLKPTPVSPKTPGVFLHAAVAGNLLEGDFLRTVPPGVSWALAWLLAAVATASILGSQRLWVQAFLPLAAAGGYAGWAVFRFTRREVWPMTPAVAAVGTACLLTFAYLAFTEGKDRRRVRRMFSQYVSPTVLAEVVDRYEDHLRAEVGQKENLTVLFSDIRGFTSLSEALPAPNVVDLLNIYFNHMTEAIFDHQGTIDKFIGDAIMCFWGAPLRLPDHAERGVRAALEMVGRLDEVNARLGDKGYPPVRIGIGLTTGEVVLGNIGSHRKLDYTVIGDDVNLASRLEGLTKIYATPVLFSESTYRALDGALPCAVVDLVRVKGKQVPIHIYRPAVAPCLPVSDFQEGHRLAQATATAFEAYRSRRWDEALERYARLPRDGTAELFLARCRTYLEAPPPPDWDGVYTLTSK